MLFIFILLTCVSAYAQNQTQKQPEMKERQVWLRLKSGQVLTGNLVKMDAASVDFTVKGILQSVPCDDLIGVMFVPPAPRPTTSASGPTSAPAPAPAPMTPKEEQPAIASQNLPDHCVRTRSGPSITLAGGQYKHEGFGNKLRDFNYRGSFTAHGGKISVYITDADNYANLVNGKKFYSLYSAKNVTEGEFNVSFKQGNYHLVWWNESRSDTRVVEAELCFVY